MDIRYKYAVRARVHATGELTEGVYRSRHSTLSGAIGELEKSGAQTVTSIKKIYVKRAYQA